MRSQTVLRLSRSWVIMKTVSPSVCCKRPDQGVEIRRGDRIETGGRFVEKDDLRDRAPARAPAPRAWSCRRTVRREICWRRRRQPDHFELGDGHFVASEIAGDVQIFRASEIARSPAPSVTRTARPAGTGCRSGGRWRATLRRRAASRSVPRISMVPWRFGIRPRMVRSSTDLPPPEAPTTPRISPRRTSSDRWSMTIWSPNPTTRSRTRMAGCCVGAAHATSRSRQRRWRTSHRER